MFTGIIEELGRVGKISQKQGFWQIGVSSKIVYPKVEVSASVSLNGVCLTLVKKERNMLFFEVVPATLKISNLKRLRVGDYVNLESSVSLGEKLEGHFVLGHIDTEAKIKNFTQSRGSRLLEIEVPYQFKKYLIPKGSIAIEGISLTISEIKTNSFLINIIPYTFQNTNLEYKKTGSYLNVEFDYLAKAVLNSLASKYEK